MLAPIQTCWKERRETHESVSLGAVYLLVVYTFLVACSGWAESAQQQEQFAPAPSVFPPELPCFKSFTTLGIVSDRAQASNEVSLQLRMRATLPGPPSNLNTSNLYLSGISWKNTSTSYEEMKESHQGSAD